MIRTILLFVLCTPPLLACARREAFLPLPPGHEILANTDKGPVPLAFLSNVHPCIEEAQGKERYRFVCTAERTMNGIGEFLVAYAYLDQTGTLFLNFTGDGDPVSARERAEVILAKANWRGDASKVITMPVH